MIEFELVQMEAEEVMSQAIEHYKSNLSKITTGRANPQILSSVKMEYYGEFVPLSQIAAISVPEPRQLLIKPFDMSITDEIVGAINSSSVGLHASNEGDKARITLPEMTTERRKELVKMLAKFTEQARVAIRGARQHANKQIKGDDDLSEDFQRDYQDDIQKLTDKFISKVDEVTKLKEQDLMTV